MANDQFGNPDLMTALQAFTEGAKSLSLQRTLQQANDAVQSIKASELDDGKKRAALQGLANQMVMHMTGTGANAAQVEQAFRAVAPAALPTTADGAMLQGILTGDQSLIAGGQKASDLATADNLKLMGAKAKIDEASQGRLFEQQARIEAMREARAAQKAAKEPNAEQAKAAGFATMAAKAEQNIAALNSSPKSARNYGLFSPAAMLEGADRVLPEAFQSGENQRLKQAQLDFTTAILRHESGAAIGVDEAAKDVSKYFPVYGDSPETVAQKEATRRTKLQTLKVAAGPAWSRVVQAIGTDPVADATANGAPSAVPSAAPFVKLYK